jgi:hypothetical protein
MPNVEVLEDVAGASSIKARKPEASTSLPDFMLKSVDTVGGTCQRLSYL